MISVDVNFSEFFIYVTYSLLHNVNHIDWSEIGQKEQLKQKLLHQQLNNHSYFQLFCHKVT